MPNQKETVVNSLRKFVSKKKMDLLMLGVSAPLTYFGIANYSGVMEDSLQKETAAREERCQSLVESFRTTNGVDLADESNTVTQCVNLLIYAEDIRDEGNPLAMSDERKHRIVYNLSLFAAVAVLAVKGRSLTRPVWSRVKNPFQHRSPIKV